MAFHRLSKSSILLAPSASAIKSLSPLAYSIPCLTAPPFPRFFSRVTTLILCFGYCDASCKAVEEVSSVEPSSTIRISNVRLSFKEVRCLMVEDIIMGSRSVSLYAGTTIVKSTWLGSARGVNGSGFFGEAWDRYFFSESCVIIGAGDQRTSARYN